MRKVRAAVFLLVCSLLGSGAASCMNPSDFTDPAGSSKKEAEAFPDYVYDSEQAQYQTNRGACIAENGYYFSASRILYFYDIGSGAAFPLCTKTSCNHSDETCNAFVSRTRNCYSYRFFMCDDSLYMFIRDDNYDLWLDRYDPGFTEKETLFCLTQSADEPRLLLTEEPVTLVHDGWLYYVTLLRDLEKEKNQEYDTTYFLNRIRLEKDALPEKLCAFDYPNNAYGGDEGSIGLLVYGEDVFCIAAVQMDGYPGQKTVWQRVIRYSEENGTELIWTYTGDEKVNLLGAEGEGPCSGQPSCLSADGKLFYLTDEKVGKGLEDFRYPEGTAQILAKEATAIASVDLYTGESRVIYQTPFWWITQLKTDGEHYYILEQDAYHKYLTALDREGNVLRRHHFENTKEYVQMMETATEQYNGALWNLANDITLIAADSRYLVLSLTESNDYKDFTSDYRREYEENSSDDTSAVSLIRTEDFVSGKDFEIRQIYERMKKRITKAEKSAG